MRQVRQAVTTTTQELKFGATASALECERCVETKRRPGASRNKGWSLPQPLPETIQRPRGLACFRWTRLASAPWLCRVSVGSRLRKAERRATMELF